MNATPKYSDSHFTSCLSLMEITNTTTHVFGPLSSEVPTAGKRGRWCLFLEILAAKLAVNITFQSTESANGA